MPTDIARRTQADGSPSSSTIAISVGFVNSIDGGHFKADPITSMQGADGYVTKYAGRAKYDDITVQVGAAMSPPFWKWVSSSLDAQAAAAQRRARRPTTSTSTSARAARSSARSSPRSASRRSTPRRRVGRTLTVKITPEHIKYKKGDGHKFSGVAGARPDDEAEALDGVELPLLARSLQELGRHAQRQDRGVLGQAEHHRQPRRRGEVRAQGGRAGSSCRQIVVTFPETRWKSG